MNQDAIRAEIVRQRAFIRAADTQGTKILALLEALPSELAPPPVVEPEAELDPSPEEEPDEVEPPEPEVDEPPPDVSPLPRPIADRVEYPSAEVAFLAGPQLALGSELNPWPWADRIMLEKGPEHAARILNAERFTNSLGGYTYYYDLGFTQYLLHFRTGDEAHRERARALVDRFVAEQFPPGGSVAPRSAAIGGVLLRALDGRPELFDLAVRWGRRHDTSWLNRFYDTTNVRLGVRDPAFTALYLAQIAAVHPDPAIRAEFLERAHKGALWFTRTQSADGGWYYTVKDTQETGSKYCQPFQMGFMFEALIATHQLTGDQALLDSLVRGCDWTYEVGFYPADPWEAMHYSVPEDLALRDGLPPGPPEKAGATWGYRHNNAPVIHAFGYAYKITGDAKYRTQGDHLFEATFGYDPADPKNSTGLAFDNGKNYNQSFRTSGRYLVWRKGR